MLILRKMGREGGREKWSGVKEKEEDEKEEERLIGFKDSIHMIIGIGKSKIFRADQ